MLKEQTCKKFIKDFSLPIQVTNPEFLPYYIDLYDDLFDTRKKWKIFESSLNQFDNEQLLAEEEHHLIFEVVDLIKNSKEYQQFTSCDIDKVVPITKEIDGVPFTKSVNIYNKDNHDKYFLSIDLKKANYQSLKTFMNGINKPNILTSDSYEDFISRFTEIELFKISKHIRQVLFGQLNMNRITHMERYLTGFVLSKLIQSLEFTPDNIKTYTHDEIIVSTNSFYDSVRCNCLKNLIYDLTSGIEVHVESFKLKYVGNNTYFKVHEVDVPTIKGGSSVYIPQLLKAYRHQPLQDEDLYFQYEKQLAKFINPLTWENL